jgi:ABC-2 type transport system ATP-binding protein
MSGGRLVAQGTLDELRLAGQTRARVLVPTADAPAAAHILTALGLPPELPPGASRTDEPALPTNATRGSAKSTLARPDADLTPPGDAGALAGERPPGNVRAHEGETALSAVLPATVAPEDVVAALVTGGVRVRGFAVQQASLEDLFVALTGEGFDVVQ